MRILKTGTDGGLKLMKFPISMKATLVAGGAATLLFTSALGAEDFAKNVALHKKYEMNPPPNYAPKKSGAICCTDSDDVAQLTDGVADKASFQKPSTVGWEGEKQIDITFDLERICKVGTVRLNLAGGGLYGVHYPNRIEVYVGNERDFTGAKLAASWTCQLLEDGKISNSWALIESIGKFGRFVKVRLLSDQKYPFVFCDEIEIFEGDGKLPPPPAGGQAPGATTPGGAKPAQAPVVEAPPLKDALGTIPLSRLKPDVKTINWTTTDMGRTPYLVGPVVYDGVKYPRTPYVVSPAELTYDLDGKYSGFECDLLPMPNKAESKSPFLFPNRYFVTVKRDGKIAVSAGPLQAGDPPFHLKVPLAGAKKFELSVRDDRDMQWGRMAWLNAVLYAPEANVDFKKASCVPQLSPSGYFAVIGAGKELECYFPGGKMPIEIFRGGMPEEGAKLTATVKESSAKTVMSWTHPLTMEEQSSGACGASLEMPLGIDRKGIYDIDLELVEGGKPVYRKTGKFSIVDDPGSNALPKDSFFGGQASIYPHFIYKHMRPAGIRECRFWFFWPAVEPRKGDFSRLERYYDPAIKNIAQTQGIAILGVLGEQVPYWANGATTGKWDDYYKRPLNFQDWRDYVTEVVTRYKDVIKSWEIYNELDCKQWKLDDQAELLKSTYTLIKRLQPEATVIGCSASCHDGLDYIESLFKKGCFEFTDAVAIHPYRRGAPESVEYDRTPGCSMDFAGMLAATKDLVDNYGGGKDVWITESAWDWEGNGMPPELQAEYTVRGHVIALASGKARKWHLFSFPAAGQRPELRPLFIAYPFMSSTLDGAQPVKALLLSKTMRAYLFAKQGQDIAVAWTTAGDGVVRFGLGAHPAEVFDMYGNKKEIKPQGGALTLNLSEAPLYVKTDKGNLLAAEEIRPIEFPAGQLRAFAGTALDLKVKVNNVFENNLSGELELQTPGWPVEPNKCPLALDKGASKECAFKVSVPSGSDYQAYPIIACLKPGGGTSEIVCGAEASVSPPLAVVVKPFDSSCWPAEKSSVEVEVKNLLDKKQEGSLSAKSMPGVQVSPANYPFTIDGGQAKSFSFEIAASRAPAPGDKLTVSAEVPGAKPISASRSAFSVRCVKKTGEKTGGETTLDKPGQMRSLVADETSSGWRGPADLSAQFSTMWDKDFLYIAVRVFDDVFFQDCGGGESGWKERYWEGDSVQLALETTGSGSYDNADEFAMLLTKDGPRLYHDKVNKDSHRRPSPDKTVPGAKLAISKFDGGILYKAALPLAEIGLAPSPGSAVGFSLLVNDNDGRGRARYLKWADGIGDKKDPGLYGALTFAE